MSTESMILETEYELMLTHLEVRSGLENFSIEDVKQELEHLLIFQDRTGSEEVS